MRITKHLFLALAVTILASSLHAQTLKGSRSSIDKQYETALAYGYSFIESSNSISNFINAGELIRIQPTRYLELHDVSYPYARSGVKLFLDRLSGQYYSACRQKLVVTSLSRPLDRQPANAADRSVHPTGMAVDLRIPPRGRCRSWLEETLLSLEAADVLDVTRERNPPHYHVAVFTESYTSYVASRTGSASEYVVRPGDSLWIIAARTGTTVREIRSINALAGDLINVGQKLQIPAAGEPVMRTVSANQLDEPHTSITEVSHRVKRGETLWKLANRYGTSVENIQRDNGLRGTQLQIGQVLRIKAVTVRI